jgi:hypothetical protein
MNKKINWIISGVIMALVIMKTAHGAIVSSPYTNTFDTAASTNDFYQGFSKVGVGERVGDQYWSWDSRGRIRNYIYTGRGLGLSYNWTAVDFGGDSETKRSFCIQSDMAAYCNDSGPAGSITPYSIQGLCALASSEQFASNTYYQGSINFTNVVGIIQISKFDQGVETVLTNMQTTLEFIRAGWYTLELEGTYENQTGNNFSLTYTIWNDLDTNSVSVIDSDPLAGTWFGFRDYAKRDGMNVFWDNLEVEVDIVLAQGTCIIIK